MTSQEIRRVAEEITAAFDPNLSVAAVIPAQGGSSYVEVMVVDTQCDEEPCRLIIGASRMRSESEFRAAMLEQLQNLKGKL
jgi:hypothetical protein